MSRQTPALVAAPSKAPTMDRLAFSRVLFTPGRVCKPIGPNVTVTFWTLIDVHPVIVHFKNSNGSVGGVFDVTEARVAGIEISNWHNGGNKPLVGAAAVKIGTRPFYRTWVLVGARGTVERKCFVCVVGISDFDIICDLKIGIEN